MVDAATLAQWAAESQALLFVTHAAGGPLIAGKVNLVDTSGGALAMTLPDPTLTREPVVVVVTGASDATITVAGGTIDGAASGTVKKGAPAQYDAKAPDYVRCVGPGVGTGGGGTKSIFTVATNYNAEHGDFRVRNIAGTSAFNFSFCVPADFGALVGAAAVAIPDGTNASADIDLSSDYGAPGEAFDNHSESDTTSTYSLVEDELVEIDLSSVLSSLSANDYVGVMIDNNAVGFSVDYIGIVLRYTPV